MPLTTTQYVCRKCKEARYHKQGCPYSEESLDHPVLVEDQAICKECGADFHDSHKNTCSSHHHGQLTNPPSLDALGRDHYTIGGNHFHSASLGISIGKRYNGVSFPTIPFPLPNIDFNEDLKEPNLVSDLNAAIYKDVKFPTSLAELSDAEMQYVVSRVNTELLSFAITAMQALLHGLSLHMHNSTVNSIDKLGVGSLGVIIKTYPILETNTTAENDAIKVFTGMLEKVEDNFIETIAKLKKTGE